MTSYVSKIIHQTAPRDTTKWHPIWKMCQDSWKKNYPDNEYIYMFWDDDDIEEIIKIINYNFNEYRDTFYSRFVTNADYDFVYIYEMAFKKFFLNDFIIHQSDVFSIFLFERTYSTF